MVVAGQVQQAVKGQDFELDGRRVAEQAGVADGDVGRDGDVAGKIGLARAVGQGGKR